MLTYQHFTLRVFEGEGSLAVARAFAAAVQDVHPELTFDGGSWTVLISDGESWVDMENWPDGEAFGPWFDRFMTDNNVTVLD